MSGSALEDRGSIPRSSTLLNEGLAAPWRALRPVVPGVADPSAARRCQHRHGEHFARDLVRGVPLRLPRLAPDLSRCRRRLAPSFGGACSTSSAGATRACGRTRPTPPTFHTGTTQWQWGAMRLGPELRAAGDLEPLDRLGLATGRAQQRAVRWTWPLTPHQWRGFVSTVSHVRLLPEDVRRGGHDQRAPRPRCCVRAVAARDVGQTRRTSFVLSGPGESTRRGNGERSPRHEMTEQARIDADRGVLSGLTR